MACSGSFLTILTSAEFWVRFNSPPTSSREVTVYNLRSMVWYFSGLSEKKVHTSLMFSVGTCICRKSAMIA